MRRYGIIVLIALLVFFIGVVWRQQGHRKLPVILPASATLPSRIYPAPLPKTRLLRRSGTLESQEKLYQAQKRLKKKEKEVGVNHPDLVPLLEHLKTIAYERLDFALAERYLRRVIAIRQGHLPPDSTELATAYREASEFYKSLGRNATAARYYDTYSGIADIDNISDWVQLVQMLVNRADIHRATKEYAKAEKDYQRAISILFTQAGSDDRGLLAPLKKLAGIYANKQQYRKALPLYRQALPIQKAVSGANSRETIRLMEQLGGILERLDRPDEAERLYKQAMEYGMENSCPALNSFNALMRLYGKQKRVNDARALHQSLDIHIDPKDNPTASFLKEHIDKALDESLKDEDAGENK